MTLNYVKFRGMSLSSIGLGCSRLGALTGATSVEAEALIAKAIEHGITFFDTASSYGQGDSERILGRAVGRVEGLCLVTKVGKQVPFKAKVLQPVKAIVRKWSRRSLMINSAARHSRGVALPVDFDPNFLTDELIKSHRRLRLETIPVVLLHSVSAEALVQGEAMAVLEAAKARGDVRAIGVSVDEISAAEATLADPRIEVVQVPYITGDSAMVDWARRAAAAGKLVVAREIFSGIGGVAPPAKSEFVASNLARVEGDLAVGVALVGTTKIEHLDQVLKVRMR